MGDEIDWQRGKGASHVTCPKKAPEPEDAIRLSGGSGYGCRGWQEGQVVRNAARRVEQGEPEFLYVLSARSRYVRDDGLSFGVGDDQGHLYSAVCRAATDDESADLRARIKAAEARTAAREELRTIARRIQDTGSMPEGDNRPDGERISDTRNIYGGGDWFVIGIEYIWYVQNNGADGDDWTRNNVRTGGAGAVGWRVSYDAQLADRLRKLAEVADRKST